MDIKPTETSTRKVSDSSESKPKLETRERAEPESREEPKIESENKGKRVNLEV